MKTRKQLLMAIAAGIIWLPMSAPAMAEKTKPLIIDPSGLLKISTNLAFPSE